MRWALLLNAVLVAAIARADDWPTELHDNKRSGVTKESLRFPLRLAWAHRARAVPQPAWPPEAKNDYYHNKYDLPERITFDHAFHVVSAAGRIYYGSSGDDSVHCLDADSGKEVWSFTTEGPVRLAPTVAGEFVLFGSDDGHVYAVNAKNGTLTWKRRLGPEDRQIPGNQRIISAWPVRTDVLVEGDKAYACCGIFPSQGVYQVTLSVKDGSEISRKKLDVTAQGYQERTFGKLMIRTGRDPRGSLVAPLPGDEPEANKETKTPAKEYPFALIRAGEVRIAGGDGKLAAFDGAGKEVWSRSVEGKVHSLAVVAARLVASTDAGLIYCFSDDGKDGPVAPAEPNLWMRPSTKPVAFVNSHSLVEHGYCLWLAPATARDVQDLADLTNGQVVIRDPDAQRVAMLRKAQTSGFGRVVIQPGPIDKLPYADMLFNTVVAAGAVTPKDEARRVLRPGGTAVFEFKDSGIERREPLKGAGEWTHMYADPANTACSGDTIAASEFRVQWFGRPGPRGLIDRHHRTVSPVYKNGRLFVPGEDRVIAVDAYNGSILWEREFPGSRRVIAFRDSSYLALSNKFLYVSAVDRCFALDPQSGAEERTFVVPPEIDGKYEWGYTAAVDGLLLGSAVKRGSIRREQNHKNTLTITHWDFAPAVGSDFLFAYEAAGDDAKWVYRAKKGLIVNPTLTIGGGRIYFVESGNPEGLTAKSAQARLPEMLKDASLVALDLKTGREVWRKPAKPLSSIQHAIFGSYSSDVFLIVGSRNQKTLWYDAHAFDARSGEALWSRSQDQQQPINGEHGEQERHPAIVNGVVYCEPKAYDLKTGKPVEWNWPWAKNARRGCGTLAASASCFFFRSDTTQTFDLATGKASPITTETRPGCWINVLPAGGLVLAPEASSGCSCNYAVQTSLALIPVPKKP
jgi:outer membrane protein assembly factor BamB